MKEIAQKIGKDKSTVTPLVNKLIRLGYIEKEKSITDKRVTYISLTSKARDIEDRFNFISSQVKETAYKDFTKEEKEIMTKIAEKYGETIDFTGLKTYEAVGCKKCNDLGYYGRIGLFEILNISEEIYFLFISKSIFKRNIVL